MSSAQFIISTTNITANSADINVVLSDVAVSNETLDIVVSTTNETVYTGSMTIPSGDTTGILSVSNLRSNTQYTTIVTSSSTYTDSAVFITLEDPTPKTPTQTQWEGLADKVNSSARIGKVLSEPSSVKYVKADNIDFATFIQSGVVEGTTVVGNTLVHITFDTPFPNTNYLVFIQKNVGGNYAATHPAVDLTSRTTSGVDVNIWSPDTSTTFNVSWLAILVS